MRHFKGKVAISVIAILICMAFVFNFGSTLASVSYSFLAKSRVDSARADSYTEYMDVSNAEGDYAYAFGSVNNKLSINYGVSAECDLKVEFTASYNSTSHIANDFELNFIDRDDWCISLTSVTTNSPSTSQTVYTLSSNTHEFKGTMYYLGKLSGSGSIGLISGVTFYNNGTQEYKADDLLSVSFTSYLVKSATENYKLSTENPTHPFYSSTNAVAYDNWIKYMKSSTEYIDESAYMIYNAYANDTYALSYPSDFEWSADLDLSQQTEPSSSNMAYRYTITKTESGNVRVMEGVIAGNTYRGGLGVFVFPSQRSKVKVSVSAYWEKNGVIQGTMPNNTIHLQLSSDLDGDMCSKDITKPTYIDVLESIMLTAEARYRDILINGYKLVLSNLSVEVLASASTEHADLDYQINNPTQKAPILARYKDIAVSSQSQQTKATLTNLSDNAIKVNSFTITGKLWYADYTAVEGGVQVFGEQVRGYLGVDDLKFDDNLWTASVSGNVVTFTAKNNSFNTYISSGYELKLIDAVTIPNQSGDLGELVNVNDSIYVYDLWCSLEINITSYSSVTSFSTSGDNSAVEIVTSAYDYGIQSGEYADVYLRNNTNQTITSVKLSNLTLAQVTSTSGFSRNSLDASASFSYTIQAFGANGRFYVSASGDLTETEPASNPMSSNALNVNISVNIKPKECVAILRITPSQKAVIYDYKILATMASGDATGGAELIKEAYGYHKPSADANSNFPQIQLINNSSTKYEFRLKSKFDISTCLQGTNQEVFSFAESGGYYYAYYVGVINENQLIQLTISNVSYWNSCELEIIAHSDGVTDSHYVTSNYSSWNPPEEWLTAMQNIYKILTATDLENV